MLKETIKSALTDRRWRYRYMYICMVTNRNGKEDMETGFQFSYQ